MPTIEQGKCKVCGQEITPNDRGIIVVFKRSFGVFGEDIHIRCQSDSRVSHNLKTNTTITVTRHGFLHP